MSILFAATYPAADSSALITLAIYAKRLWSRRLPVGAHRGSARRRDRSDRARLGRRDGYLRPGAECRRVVQAARSVVPAAQCEPRGGGRPPANELGRSTSVRCCRRSGSPTLILQRSGDRDVNVEEGTLDRGADSGSEVRRAPRRRAPHLGGRRRRGRGRDGGVPHREPPAQEPDRVLATVLFTDIVGSTERAADLGDRRWRELRRRASRRASARELDRFRGREIDTAGDGFLASFDGPARAHPVRPVRSAKACRRSGSSPRGPPHRRGAS